LLNPSYIDNLAKDTNDMVNSLEGTEMLLNIIETHSTFVTPIDGIFDELYSEQLIIEKQ